MLRYPLIGLAAFLLFCATLIPDEALARRGGVRAGGFHAGGARVAHVRHAYRPIPGRPIARTAVRRGVYRGAAYGAGAAAYGYYNNRCHHDTYGNWVCPHQRPY